MIFSITTPGPDETRNFGIKLGSNLKGDEIICLYGDLGAGKTSLSQGIIVGALPGTDPYPRSPTYSLINRYEGDIALYHIDLYRLGGEEELYEIGFDELLDSGGVFLIEWAEKLGSLKPDKRVDIRLKYAGDLSRIITVNGVKQDIELPPVE